jgi:hypothetical protein
MTEFDQVLNHLKLLKEYFEQFREGTLEPSNFMTIGQIESMLHASQLGKEPERSKFKGSFGKYVTPSGSRKTN